MDATAKIIARLRDLAGRLEGVDSELDALCRGQPDIADAIEAAPGLDLLYRGAKGLRVIADAIEVAATLREIDAARRSVRDAPLAQMTPDELTRVRDAINALGGADTGTAAARAIDTVFAVIDALFPDHPTRTTEEVRCNL